MTKQAKANEVYAEQNLTDYYDIFWVKCVVNNVSENEPADHVCYLLLWLNHPSNVWLCEDFLVVDLDEVYQVKPDPSHNENESQPSK